MAKFEKLHKELKLVIFREIRGKIKINQNIFFFLLCCLKIYFLQNYLKLQIKKNPKRQLNWNLGFNY